MLLMDVDLVLNIVECDELDLFVFLIEKYEEEMFFIDFFDLIEVIKFWME